MGSKENGIKTVEQIGKIIKGESTAEIKIGGKTLGNIDLKNVDLSGLKDIDLKNIKEEPEKISKVLADNSINVDADTIAKVMDNIPNFKKDDKK